MKIIKYFTVILAITSLSFCDKKETIIGPPEAHFTVSPDKGKTTTIFSFNTAATTNPGLDKPELFFRWDWDGDGNWDTHFSKSIEYQYRYRIPGEYTAVMEVRNVTGLSDTLSTGISVERGNSAPFPSLIVSPELGHIRTNFVFDASGTYDDEDSLNTLKFRWDWQGDGIYDTEYSNEPVIEHMFQEAGFYRVIMQVTDPWGLTARTNRLIDVSRNNPKLVASFTWGPEGGTTSDIFTLDASASYDPDDPGNTFQYRWDFNNDGNYDTEYSSNPVVEYQFKEEGENTVKLEIKDQYGLIKTAVNKFEVLHSNQPPTATFEIGSIYGNLTTEFYFDAAGVRDDEDFFDVLEVRWDFESDGIYDTEFSMTKTAKHFYGYAGDITITMEVKDSDGLTDTTSRMIHISGGTNPTSLVFDIPRGLTYGAVQLGTQWWLTENIKASTGRTCYSNSAQNCEIYGGLYTWPSAMQNSTSEKAQGLCPAGWHVPTVDEWYVLFDYLGQEQARTELEPSGSTDFRLLYAGQQNSSGRSEYLGTVVNFWTSTRVTGTNAWAISLQDGKDQIFKITLGQSYKISVRCVKN